MRYAAILLALALASCATTRGNIGDLHPSVCHDPKPGTVIACGPVAMVRP